MTEIEIIKALECCSDENNCAECPLKGTRFELDHSCAEELMKLSAETIKNLMAENERLQEKYNKTMYNLKAVLNERTDHTEAIKKFAERLKELPSVTNCEYEWFHLDIDNLVKEMECD